MKLQQESSQFNQIVNFPSFLSFRIGSIAQNEYPEMSEIFKSFKSLNFFCQSLKDSTGYVRYVILKAYSHVWDDFWQVETLFKWWKMLFISP